MYNVHLTETVQSIENTIPAKFGVKPLSCFQVKSRDEESSAFRVCINDDISSDFINPLQWLNGIKIKSWKFKPKNTAAQTAAAAVANVESIDYDIEASSDNINNFNG